MATISQHPIDIEQVLIKNASSVEAQRIMLVNDKPANLLAMRALLKKINNEIEVIEATSSNLEVLSLALKHRYSLIILDLQMSDLDGHKIARALHNSVSTSHIPIIFISTILSDEQEWLDGLHSTTIDTVKRPINEDLFLSKVRVFLELDRQKFELRKINLSLEEKNKELKKEIVQRISAQNQLQTLSEAVGQHPVAVMITDGKGQIKFINDPFEEISGYGIEKTARYTIFDTLQIDKKTFASLCKSLGKGGIWRGEFIAVSKDNIQLWLNVTALRMENNNNSLRYLYLLEDISLRKKYETEFVNQPQLDELSPLSSYFMDQDRRRSHYVIVLLLELVDFKTIHEILGADTADVLLKRVTHRLKKVLREADSVAKLRDNELFVMMENSVSKTGGDITAEKLLTTLKDPFYIANREILLTGNVVVFYASENDSGSHEFTLNAEDALHRAKQQGGYSDQFHSAELNLPPRNRLNIEAHLRMALQNSEFEVHFQPQLDSQSGKPIAAEALLRWTNADFGKVSPSEFIPITEGIGLVHEIGLWVLENALQSVAIWRQLTGHSLRVAVNVLSCQLERSTFLNQIDALFQLSGYDPSMLEIEITESLFLENQYRTLKNLKRLRDIGVDIAIDDFGTGHSSLNDLKNHPISTLKIDQSFIRDIEQDNSDAALVKSVIAMAHGLDMRVVAEGVETESQKLFLQKHHCDIMQGYLFSKPLSHAAFLEYIENS